MSITKEIEKTTCYSIVKEIRNRSSETCQIGEPGRSCTIDTNGCNGGRTALDDNVSSVAKSTLPTLPQVRAMSGLEKGFVERGRIHFQLQKTCERWVTVLKGQAMSAWY